MWADFVSTIAQTAQNLHQAAEYIDSIVMITGVTPYLATARFIMGEPLWLAMVTTFYVAVVFAFIKIGKSILEFVRSMIPII